MAQQDITAIIYDKRGTILSVGKNSYIKTHPLQYKHACRVGKPNHVFLHAEVAAIIKCKDLTKAHKIVVVRIKRDGHMGNAKPCGICQSAIKEAGIKIVEHT